MKDLFGKAILDYQTNNLPEDLITETSISEADEMKVAYLFRTFDQMPKIEQMALEMCFGKILDIGCGAGSHSLYLQQKGFDVTAIDISKNAIEACKIRGLKNAKIENMLEIENQKFDTILLLMNGTGIFGTLSKATTFLQKLRSLLHENGQILIDSSDLIYMYDEEDLEEIRKSNCYYGEINFSLQYKNEKEVPFPWLYLDYKTLENLCIENSLHCEKIIEGDNFDYLAKLV
jgi:2-polyprenyl-3-methyl-5-hydroxy-6-metoxy-1,4-benzoquinol methylase